MRPNCYMTYLPIEMRCTYRQQPTVTLFLADIDECVDGSHGCEQLCNNTKGSYLCSCLDGYRLQINRLSCQGSYTNLMIMLACSCCWMKHYLPDINECELELDECSQNCRNSNGSYTCSCNSGFLLDMTDEKSCKGIALQCRQFSTWTSKSTQSQL